MPAPGSLLGGFPLFGEAQVPFEREVLALGVAHDPLPVATELGVVGRKQHEAGERPLTEGVDHLWVPVVGLHIPVGRDRPEVDDPDVPYRLGSLLGGRFFHPASVPATSRPARKGRCRGPQPLSQNRPFCNRFNSVSPRLVLTLDKGANP